MPCLTDLLPSSKPSSRYSLISILLIHFLYCGILTPHSAGGEAAKCRAVQPHPSPSEGSRPDTSQGTAGCPGCQGALLTKVQLTPQILFCEVALQLLVPQSVHLSRAAPTQMQHTALTLVKHHVGNCPVLQLAKISLLGLSAPEGVNASSQFSVVCKPSPLSRTLTKTLKRTGLKKGSEPHS